MSNYPAGVSGSHPYFNQPDEEVRTCRDCVHCQWLTVHGERIGLACDLLVDVGGDAIVVTGEEPVWECFEERGDR